tara:strand:+ start:4245 stop:4742 length:498 start_codon:yes stop_codon:yes gene_type:complete
MENKSALSTQIASMSESLTNANQTNSHSELLKQLRIISQIKEGQKINTSSRNLEIDFDSYLLSFKRWWNKETRNKNIIFVKELLHDTFSIVDSILKQPKKDQNHLFLLRVLKTLQEAKGGIERLSYVYQHDPSLKADLDMCQEDISIYVCLLFNTCNSFNTGNER